MNNIMNIILLQNDDSEYGVGKITIGDFDESFDMALNWWTVEQYLLQWEQGLLRLKNYDRSCLITSVNNPYKNPYINWWLLYKENGVIYIQNHIIVGEIYKNMIGKNSFTPENCYGFIPRRYISDDTSERLSEWHVKFSDLSF